VGPVHIPTLSCISWYSVFIGRQFGVLRDRDEYGADVHGVRQMIIYGLKGLGSYARHARMLGEWDDSIGASTTEVYMPTQTVFSCQFTNKLFLVGCL